MKLIELFDVGVEVEWVTSNQALWTIDGTRYVFDIEKDQLSDGVPCLAVSFGARAPGQDFTYSNTGTGNQFQVYSTVLACVKHYISQFGELPLWFSAEDRGRQRLYGKFIKKFLPNWNLTQQDQIFVAYPPNYS